MTKEEKLRKLAEMLRGNSAEKRKEREKMEKKESRVERGRRSEGILGLKERIARLKKKLAMIELFGDRETNRGDRETNKRGRLARLEGKKFVEVNERDRAARLEGKRQGNDKNDRLAKIREKLEEIEEKRAARLEGKRQGNDKNDRLAKIREKIKARRLRLARMKRRSEEVDSVLENADNDMREETMDSNFALPNPPVPFGDKKDLDRAREDAIDQLPPTFRAEDVREAYKKALSLVWRRKAKNLEQNELKASLYDLLVGYGIKHKAAIGIIETAFQEAGDRFLAGVMKRAEEVMEYGPETVAELGKEVEVVCYLPEDVVKSLSEDEEEEEEEEKEEAKEMKEKIVEGSFRIPKVSSSAHDSLLSKAVPSYIDIKEV
uniref:Uncharacterized protein n=1 Tax=candidate division CPR3 bacterium TaxID=2268181 RepID=A0A7V3J9B5_UNCC3